MSIEIVEKIGDVKIYGNGFLGGKGEGLVRINECLIPKAHKLRTRILTTVFYQHFLERSRKFPKEDVSVFSAILSELGEIPISVRSSATNEASVLSGGEVSVHAGENTSFMLPNNHADPAVRLKQLRQAITHIFSDFIRRQPTGSPEEMAIVINPIPGTLHDTLAGPVYYPLVSGVANSFFPYALKMQDKNEGFARIAFGHGYATVLDDFPVVSMATLQNPIPVKLLGEGQSFFYAVDMTRNDRLSGKELETMKKLNIRFADFSQGKRLGMDRNRITFERIVQENDFEFRDDLVEIMDVIFSKIATHFQIEFIFNVDFSKTGKRRGTFHVVQLTPLPELKFETIRMPKKIKHTYLTVTSLQGHGIKKGIKHVIVVSPFIYTREMHDRVRRKISAINRRMNEDGERFIIIVPGRIGSKNRDWGIQVDFDDINNATAIFEYGVDIAGRPEPTSETENTAGGIYGSHFLYMIQGGYNEDQKRIQTRMYGSQGTHFLTNLIGNKVIYGYIAPNKDTVDPWFFSTAANRSPLNILTFPEDVSIYADSINQQCSVLAE